MRKMAGKFKEIFKGPKEEPIKTNKRTEEVLALLRLLRSVSPENILSFKSELERTRRLVIHVDGIVGSKSTVTVEIQYDVRSSAPCVIDKIRIDTPKIKNKLLFMEDLPLNEQHLVEDKLALYLRLLDSEHNKLARQRELDRLFDKEGLDFFFKGDKS